MTSKVVVLVCRGRRNHWDELVGWNQDKGHGLVDCDWTAIQMILNDFLQDPTYPALIFRQS